MAERVTFTPPFGDQCSGCTLVQKATPDKQGVVFVVTCSRPDNPGENADVQSTGISLKGNADYSQEGLCQVIEAKAAK